MRRHSPVKRGKFTFRFLELAFGLIKKSPEFGAEAGASISNVVRVEIHAYELARRNECRRIGIALPRAKIVGHFLPFVVFLLRLVPFLDETTSTKRVGRIRLGVRREAVNGFKNRRHALRVFHPGVNVIRSEIGVEAFDNFNVFLCVFDFAAASDDFSDGAGQTVRIPFRDEIAKFQIFPINARGIADFLALRPQGDTKARLERKFAEDVRISHLFQQSLGSLGVVHCKNPSAEACSEFAFSGGFLTPCARSCIRRASHLCKAGEGDAFDGGIVRQAVQNGIV